jgi:hypothetical protein
MMTLVRGSNPIWFEVDLTAHAFDDTFYLFILDNEIPYGPLPTWQDPFGNVEWSNPIRFLANGTLPNNIYFDPDVVYRLEFRQGPTQQDPLIYLVENYVPGGSGITPVDEAAFSTDNQITNPQFALLNFSSPLMLTSISTQVLEVAPGWFLHLTGSGNVILTQVLLNSAVTSDPTNASYAIRIQLSGSWTNAYLSQRFTQNGVLWANSWISTSVTALSGNPPQTVSAILVDSQGNTLATVLNDTPLTSSFNAYPGVPTQLPASIDTDFPPTAYIEYQLTIPNNADVTVTSFQLIASDVNVAFPYEQTTIERQIDHTWHYYRNSVLMQPKESLLTGWDFGLNPWQFTTTSNTTLSSQCAYTADQTIVYQQAGGSEVAIGQSGAQQNNAFVVTAVGNNSRFALIQYIEPNTIRDVWQYILSSLVRAYISTPTNNTTVRFKMRLIYRTSLPPTIGATEPISSWTGSGDPTFAAGWTAISPKNDPFYTFGAQGQTFNFEGMQLPTSTNANMTLGIVIYTLDAIIPTGTPDKIIFERVSLTRTDFAIDSQILTFDETLRRCQYYFESSKNTFVQLTTSGAQGALIRTCNAFTNGVTGNIDVFPRSFDIEYKTLKCFNASLSFYDEGGTINQVTTYLRNNGAQIATSAKVVTLGWASANNGNKGIQFVATTQTASPFWSVSGSTTNSTDAYISFHYGADARLGL